MTRYIAQRLLAGLLTTFIVSLLIFVITYIHFKPESFIMPLGGEELTEKDLRMIREAFGRHGSLPMQYFRWMGGWITGQCGESAFSSEGVWENFSAKLPTTLQLVAMAQAIAALIGIPAGIIMALNRNSWLDILGRAVSRTSLALPIFLTGILLLVAGIHFLDWASESETTRGLLVVEIPGDSQVPFFWSALALGISASAAIALMMRSSALAVLRQDNVQAISVSEPGHSAAVFLHTLRYTLVSAAVILGLTFPAIVGGTVIMERIFVLDGVGNMLSEAMNQRDYPVIESLSLFFSVWVIAVNTLVDILCGWLAPSVRSSRKSPREEWDHLANPVRLV